MKIDVDFYADLIDDETFEQFSIMMEEENDDSITIKLTDELTGLRCSFGVLTGFTNIAERDIRDFFESYLNDVIELLQDDCIYTLCFRWGRGQGSFIKSLRDIVSFKYVS